MDTQDGAALHQHIPWRKALSPPDWLFQQRQPLFLDVTAAFLQVPGSDIENRVCIQKLLCQLQRWGQHCSCLSKQCQEDSTHFWEKANASGSFKGRASWGHRQALVMFWWGWGMTEVGRIVLYSACGQRESLSSGLFTYYLQDGKKFTFNEH